MACLFACSGYDREEFRMEVGKKYDLKKWPDSAYVDTLDRFFKTEPVKQSAKQKAEITMNMSNNAVSLPKKNANTLEKNIQNARESISKKNEETKKTESFPDKFFNALYKLSENPNSTEFGKKHRAKNGETLDDLLLRVYGSQAKRVPKYISESMLKQLNPGTDFSSLSEGEMVLLPAVR
ncbi:MAG: hypothetical protein LBB36_00340 [Fibromonadaceae bacterium]|nr:hypothetical protein [Fibromonadaceae bacterium]